MKPQINLMEVQAPRPGDPGQFRQGGLQIKDMLQHCVGKDDIHAVSGEGGRILQRTGAKINQLLRDPPLPDHPIQGSPVQKRSVPGQPLPQGGVEQGVIIGLPGNRVGLNRRHPGPVTGQNQGGAQVPAGPQFQHPPALYGNIMGGEMPQAVFSHLDRVEDFPFQAGRCGGKTRPIVFGPFPQYAEHRISRPQRLDQVARRSHRMHPRPPSHVHRPPAVPLRKSGTIPGRFGPFPGPNRALS